MANIYFGATSPEEIEVKDLGAYARKVEDLGFDSLWTTENLNSDAPSLECFAGLAYMAAHTSRVLLGTAVVVLPLRNPVLVAQTFTSLDVLSKGRVILGVGVGGNERNLNVYGGTMQLRGKRCDEQMEILKRVWTETSVTYEGDFYRFEEFTLMPRPVQDPHPPMWIGGCADSVLRRTGRWADGFMGFITTSDALRDIFDRVDSYTEGYGRDPSSVTKALHMYMCLADSPSEASKTASEVLSKRYHGSVSKTDDGSVLFGTPEDCKKRLQEFADVGVTHFVLNPTCHPDQMVAQLEVVSKEVLPHFRSD